MTPLNEIEREALLLAKAIIKNGIERKGIMYNKVEKRLLLQMEMMLSKRPDILAAAMDIIELKRKIDAL